jgi:isopentenyl-diphosphate Delta-isomerase
MNKQDDIISKRKKEHLELSLNADVSFKTKTSGFDYYEFIHNAATEVELDKITFETKFFKKVVNYPFIISCMTGGTEEAENINAQLAIAAEELKIPIGVGSQRQALENNVHNNTYKIIRKNAPTVPVLGNLGAAELVKLKSSDPIKKLIDLIEADAFVIHLNPLQELLQPEGNPYFKGLLKSLRRSVKEIKIPIIVKEIGTGISGTVAKNLLDTGVKAIDVAGAGGTSWAAIEMLRNKSVPNDYFWDWGLPTSFCLRENSKLKKKFKFVLIGSGGINSAVDAAKAIALGADYVASARTVLKEQNTNGVDGVMKLITDWFSTIKNIMFLTGSNSIKQFQKNKLIRTEFLY